MIHTVKHEAREEGKIEGKIKAISEISGLSVDDIKKIPDENDK